MKADEFRAPQAGRVVRTMQGYTAFIPAPPPPPIVYDDGLVLALSRADAALSELAGLGRFLPEPRLLIAPYVRREAVLSSKIEGTRVSLAELLLDEARTGTEPSADAETREVRNYVVALEHGIARLSDLPLSLRLVRELHERLMTGVRGGYATPGEFRRTQNWIGPPGSTPATAPYVPPPPDEMVESLARWERFINQRGSMPDLVQCALMHEHFEAIHPFLDGNGRVGRLLITLFLIERQRLPQPLLYLSAYLEAHRNDYYDLLLRVRTDGDWNAWLRFFLIGVEETCRVAVGQAVALLDLRERYRALLAGKPRALALLDGLFANPYLSVPRAAQALDASQPTARQAVAALEAAGVVERLPDRVWPRLYLARSILRAVEGGPWPG